MLQAGGEALAFFPEVEEFGRLDLGLVGEARGKFGVEVDELVGDVFPFRVVGLE